MTPYYDEDGITIYHGDCREILPSIKADAVITDPPYGVGFYDSDVAVLTGVLLGAWVRTFRFVAVFGWPERLVSLCVEAGHAPDEWITWWAMNGRNRGFTKTGLWREVECIAAFGRADWTRLTQAARRTSTPMPNHGLRGVRTDGLARMGDVWRDESPNLNPNQPDRLHPNEKPIGVVSRLVDVTSGGVVDPFMGSGTTLVAAKQLGRPAIGIEVKENYCEIAAQRLAQGVLAL